MKLRTFGFGTLACLFILTGCDRIEDLCAGNPELCTVPTGQEETPTVAPTEAEEAFPAWCNANAAADPNMASAITDFGKWTATCGADVWVLQVSSTGDKTVAATGFKKTDPSVTSNFTGVMSYNCMYLAPSSAFAPVITASLVALSNTTVYATDGSCKLRYDTEDQ